MWYYRWQKRYFLGLPCYFHFYSHRSSVHSSKYNRETGTDLRRFIELQIRQNTYMSSIRSLLLYHGTTRSLHARYVMFKTIISRYTGYWQLAFNKTHTFTNWTIWFNWQSALLLMQAIIHGNTALSSVWHKYLENMTKGHPVAIPKMYYYWRWCIGSFSYSSINFSSFKTSQTCPMVLRHI